MIKLTPVKPKVVTFDKLAVGDTFQFPEDTGRGIVYIKTCVASSIRGTNYLAVAISGNTAGWDTPVFSITRVVPVEIEATIL